MSSREPFWMQPRWLSRALDRGDLTVCEFTLLCYLGGSGLEHHGVSSTLTQLAATLGYSTKWISSSLHGLRRARLVEFELRSGQRRPFFVTAGPALRSGASALYFEPTTSEVEPTPEVTSEVTAPSEFSGDLGSKKHDKSAHPQAGSGFAPRATSEVTSPSKNENDNSKPLIYEERLVPSRLAETHGERDETGALLDALGLGSTNEYDIPPEVVARRIGEEGFVAFVHDLRGLGVLDREEVRNWLMFHGSVLRLAQPLDDGERFDERSLAALQRELGETS